MTKDFCDNCKQEIKDYKFHFSVRDLNGNFSIHSLTTVYKDSSLKKDVELSISYNAQWCNLDCFANWFHKILQKK